MQSVAAWLNAAGGDSQFWWVITAIGLACFLLGWLVAKLFSTRKIATLEAMLEYEIKSSEERIAAMENSFSALSAEALRENNQSFIHLATQVLGRHYSEADSGLHAREMAINNLVKPLEAALKSTHEQLNYLDKSTRQTHGELGGQIKAMSGAHALLHQETRNLAQALRRPEVRGQWGELTLKRLLELSGMNEHGDFSEQVSIKTDDGLIRPDLIINLPLGRQIVVDVKTPLDAYLDAFNSEDDKNRKQKLKLHADQLKQRIAELAKKQYWAQFEQAPDFVILFIPGDQFLAAALEQNSGLLEQALAKNIILATPTSLVALLRVIAYGWRQSELDEQTKLVRNLATEFDKRLNIFSRHLGEIGEDINRAAKTYNRALGSFNRKLKPISRQFEKFNTDIQRADTKEVDTLPENAKESKSQPRG